MFFLLKRIANCKGYESQLASLHFGLIGLGGFIVLDLLNILRVAANHELLCEA